ncbi:lytic polysaccharide monooxygenase auxiliary activity family 9 protein [Streptomyces silvisoli]|uniref:Lytic polysaccharide monooxygenase n=1 Tax=Streptomyces silvisoli TaxID=3034235 RepID=A0ABT5ZKS6_9ACTN|nr:lytic polysaccharide monooxygenase [Streptomyces silvisoli]MDF3290414.1 lytic polysaccharide monooxygenase [Streptomyces silvisoli]
MPIRRKAAIAVVVGSPLLFMALTATPARAHGSLDKPVSRVLACYQEGPEHPASAACRAAVAVGGTQALYDWNAVRLGDAGGRSRQIIPDGKLCSAGVDEFKGLDLARADWPATPMSGGPFTFSYKATAAHKGTFELYITKDGYDPTKPLKWSDLEDQPFATATNPPLSEGSYTFSGNVPRRTGRHLIYSVWQRSDSPEAFYTCSDVVFGGGKQGGAAPAASAPSDRQLAAGAARSSMKDMPGMRPAANRPVPNGSAAEPRGTSLAETGSSGGTTALGLGGAAAVAVGCVVVLTGARRRAAGRNRS